MDEPDILARHYLWELEFSRKQADADARIAAIKSQALSNIDDVAADSVQAIIEKFTTSKITPASIKSAVTKAKV